METVSGQTSRSLATGIPDTESEYELSDSNFDRISKKVYKMTGIVIPQHKRQMIYSRLVRRLRECDIKSFSDYLNFIETKSGINELDSFTNAVTTNITGFFREKHHFVHLGQDVSRLAGSNHDKVQIWSAGCSTGQEPYSIAMTIHEPLTSIGGSYRILATDLDTSVLQKARSRTYDPGRDFEALSDYSKYYSKNESGIEIKKQLADNIFFKRLNLFEELPFSGKFDYIFCRNVLIYFDVKHKIQVIEKLVDRLKPGGFLYLGHSESLFEEVPELLSRGNTIYEKIG